MIKLIANIDDTDVQYFAGKMYDAVEVRAEFLSSNNDRWDEIVEHIDSAFYFPELAYVIDAEFVADDKNSAKPWHKFYKK